jgi:flagellar protein FlaI
LVGLFKRKGKKKDKGGRARTIPLSEALVGGGAGQAVQAAQTGGSTAVSVVHSSMFGKGFKTLKTYSLEDPWVRAKIVQNVETGETIYVVDEVPMNREEMEIYKRILDILYWEMEPPKEGEDPYEHFRKVAKDVVMRYRIKFTESLHPGISWEKIQYYVIRDTIGFGKIDPLMKDPYIEDISCDGVGKPIYVWHREYESIPTNIVFTSDEELDSMVSRLAHKAGKHVSVAFPIVDAILPGGHRLAATYKREVSMAGSSFTIRKFSKVPLSITQIVNWGTMSPDVAAYLWILLLEGNSGFVSGETASGKTTTLNAIVAFINPTAKIVTIEDTAELNVPHPNWVRELTRDTGSPETSVTMFDLLKAALRQRPNYIIVGEIRGAEGLIAFQAMQTGHPVLATFHAASVERLVQRLTSPPINVPKTQIDNLNFVVIQNAIYREGVLVRRVLSVNEIIGYDPRTDAALYVPAFTWDPVKDRFTFRGRGTSYLLEEKIGVKRGLSRRNMFLIYDEMELRAKIIKALIEKKVFNYYQVFRVLARIYAMTQEYARKASKEEAPYAIIEALEDALKKIKRGELIK